jgi:hypothetical protein
MGKNWSGGLPAATPTLLGLKANMTFQAHVKAMHHWIRKGDARKAALSARDAAHIGHMALRLREGHE